MIAHSRSTKHLVIVQFAGDYREAYIRLAAGGAETYRGQSYSVGFVASLASDTLRVTTITCMTEEHFEVELAYNVRAIGLGFRRRISIWRLLVEVIRQRPNFLAIRAPIIPLIYAAVLMRVHTLLIFANSYSQTDLRTRLKLKATTIPMRRKSIELIANHGRASTMELSAAGVPSTKLVAWDFPAFDGPPHSTITIRKQSGVLRVMYVGTVSEEKGVGDLVRGIARLAERGVPVSATIYGPGEIPRYQKLASDLRIGALVSLAGPLRNDRVIEAMTAHDVVVIPSQHVYTEGLPLTLYEAYASGTPIVVSSHKMLASNVQHRTNGLIFDAGNYSSLAHALELLASDDELYSRLAQSGPDAWTKLQISAKWHQLFTAWLPGQVSIDKFVAEHFENWLGDT